MPQGPNANYTRLQSDYRHDMRSMIRRGWSYENAKDILDDVYEMSAGVNFRNYNPRLSQGKNGIPKTIIESDRKSSVDNERKLLELDYKAFRQHARAIIRKAFRPMLADMRSRINDQTGLLGGSLKIASGKRDYSGKISMHITANTTRKRWTASGRHAHTGGRYKMTDSYKVYYARPLEMGHKITAGGRVSRKHGGLTGTYRVTGQVEGKPFMGPAFDTAEETARSVIEQELGTKAEQEFSKP